MATALSPAEPSLRVRAGEVAKFYVKGGPAPQGSFRTRSLLKTSRYVFKFVFWRLLRWAKYAAIGALVASVGAGVLGTAISGAGMLIVPSVPVGICIGLATAAVKFGWRHSRFAQAFRQGGEGDPRLDERLDANDEVSEKPTVWERL